MIIFQELQHQSWPCYYQVHFLVASIHQTLLPLHPSTWHKQNSSPDCLLFTHHSKGDRADTHKTGQPSIYERWVFIKKVQIKCIEKDGGRAINYSSLPPPHLEAIWKDFIQKIKTDRRVVLFQAIVIKQKELVSESQENKNTVMYRYIMHHLRSDKKLGPECRRNKWK